jgi:hypothetical protein
MEKLIKNVKWLFEKQPLYQEWKKLLRDWCNFQVLDCPEYLTEQEELQVREALARAESLSRTIPMAEWDNRVSDVLSEVETLESEFYGVYHLGAYIVYANYHSDSVFVDLNPKICPKCESHGFDGIFCEQCGYHYYTEEK